jgi:hypothetical protein
LRQALARPSLAWLGEASIITINSCRTCYFGYVRCQNIKNSRFHMWIVWNYDRFTRCVGHSQQSHGQHRDGRKSPTDPHDFDSSKTSTGPAPLLRGGCDN